MERLTDKRGARSWFLYHLGWYLNLLLVLAVLVAALYFFVRIMSGSETELYDAVMMMSFVILAAILLMGAGLSRYQARLEGQHLELKKTIVALGERVSALEPEEEKHEASAQV
ncbi:MAG: hypothetical protein ACE15E_16140 [Acidobacteriota bacterium]